MKVLKINYLNNYNITIFSFLKTKVNNLKKKEKKIIDRKDNSGK